MKRYIQITINMCKVPRAVRDRNERRITDFFFLLKNNISHDLHKTRKKITVALKASILF
jgi:hypothetical protein